MFIMNSKTLFYLTLLILIATAASANGTEAKQGPLTDSHTNATITPMIDAQVPSNNKPLLIKGPTVDNYNQAKNLNASLNQEQAVVIQPQTKSQEDGLSATSTNIKTTQQAPNQPPKTPTTHQSTPNKTDNSIKTVDQQPKKESVAKQPTENNSKPLSTPEEQKKREDKLKTQAIEEKIQRENLPKLAQNQTKVIVGSEQTKPPPKEQVKDKKVAVRDQATQKQENTKQETTKPQNNIVEIIFPHPDEQKTKVQAPQARETTISKEPSDKPVKSENKTVQTPTKNNISKAQKAPTQQIKIISLEEETMESEQPSANKEIDAEKVTPSKPQQDSTKKAVPKQGKEKKEQSKQPQTAFKIEEKAAAKEGIDNSSLKITPVVKQTQLVRQVKEIQGIIDRKQAKQQESSQKQQPEAQKEALVSKLSKPVVQQAQQKTIKHPEARQKQATKQQNPVETPQSQSKGETKQVTQIVQAIEAQQNKQQDKPPHSDPKNQMPFDTTQKEQKQPDLKQLLQEVKLDMNEKAKLNVIKHLQNQIKQLQQQTKKTHEKTQQKEASFALKPQELAKEQHLKQQQPVSLQIGQEQSSQQIMDTPTILVIIVMTFIISIPIFREIKSKQNAPPQSSRKQTNDPASATQDANQRLDLQFTDLDNQTGCAIGEPIDQQQR